MISMETEELYLDFGKEKTYCRILPSASKKTPLLFLHGGPGSGHDSFELLDGLREKDDRTLIFYDQLGCGRSTARHIDPKKIDMELWIKELENVIQKLSLSSVHLLGHSFGGMLLQEFLLQKRPKEVRKAIFSSTLSSSKLWEKETKRLLRSLPSEDQEAIRKAEEAKDYDGEGFQRAMKDYALRYIGREADEKAPECLRREKNPQAKIVYLANWGPSEFLPTGRLKNFDTTARLKEITIPVLLLSGTEDESTPLINKMIYDNLQCEKKWVLLPKARHRTYDDQREKYEESVMGFLKED